MSGLLPLLAAAAAGLLPCSYRRAGSQEIAPQGPCASRAADGTIRIDKSHLRLLDYGSQGRAEVFVERAGWVYVRRGGATLEVLASDNGPDGFSDGLVRIRRNGKIGYANRSFRTVVAPRFDFGWPFEEGRALVCLGCAPAELDSGKEGHSPVSGGKWGYVDLEGREVVPILLSREEAIAKAPGR
jgi:hypothetical protein